MATVELDYQVKNTAKTADVGEIRKPTRVVYHCHIALVREDDGSYCAIVLNLPGASSGGATEDEAMENVRESICGLVDSYSATGDPIPWQDPVSEDIPADAKTKWILVNV